MSKIPRRIPGELSKALKSTPPGMVIEADPANIMIWNVTIAGPAGTAYDGGQFHVRVIFPSNYPFEAPALKFTHPVWHPNVAEQPDQGTTLYHICGDGLEPGTWRAAKQTLDLIKIVQELLATPNAGHPLNEKAAVEYLENRKEFDRKAKEYTQRYAH